MLSVGFCDHIDKVPNNYKNIVVNVWLESVIIIIRSLYFISNQKSNFVAVLTILSEYFMNSSTFDTLHFSIINKNKIQFVMANGKYVRKSTSPQNGKNNFRRGRLL